MSIPHSSIFVSSASFRFAVPPPNNSANIIPNIMHEMTYSYLNKNIDKALDLQLRSLNLINNLFIEVNCYLNNV